MLTDKEKQKIQEEVEEEGGIFGNIIDEKLQPINKKLDILLHKIDLLTQGAISTVTRVDEIQDEETKR